MSVGDLDTVLLEVDIREVGCFPRNGIGILLDVTMGTVAGLSKGEESHS